MYAYVCIQSHRTHAMQHMPTNVCIVYTLYTYIHMCIPIRTQTCLHAQP